MDLKALVWYRAPINGYSTCKVDLFGIKAKAGFGNTNSDIPKEIQYYLPSQGSLKEFYARPIILNI